MEDIRKASLVVRRVYGGDGRREVIAGDKARHFVWQRGQLNSGSAKSFAKLP